MTQPSGDITSKLSSVKVEYIKKFLQGNRVLDTGAGYCYYSEWLVSMYPGIDVVSLDRLDLTSNGYNFMQVDLEEPIPVADERFQTVLAFDIIEHIDHEKLLLKELYRVCERGGVLIGSVPHDDDGFLPAYNLTFKHRKDITHKRYYSRESIYSALTEAGFSPVTVHPQGTISPYVIAEFFPMMLQGVVKKMVTLLRYAHLVRTNTLTSDLFFVAYKR